MVMLDVIFQGVLCQAQHVKLRTLAVSVSIIFKLTQQESLQPT